MRFGLVGRRTRCFIECRWELYIPSDLGYGDRGAGGKIPGGAVLIFTLEMIKVKGASKEL